MANEPKLSASQYDGLIIRPIVERRHDRLYGRCYRCMAPNQYMYWDERLEGPGPGLERQKREAFRDLALHIAGEHGLMEPRIKTLWDR